MGTAQYNDSSVKERPRVTTPHGDHDAKTPAASGDPTLSWQVLEGATMWILAPSELERLGWRFMTSLCAFAGYETFHGRRPDGGALIAAPGQTGFIHVHGSKANIGNVKAFAGYGMFHGRRPDGSALIAAPGQTVVYYFCFAQTNSTRVPPPPHILILIGI